jgi:uncharacterized membrane protein
VSFDDWIRALHVLSAFAYVAGLGLFWILIVAVRRTDLPERTIRLQPLVKVGNVSVGVGAVGTIVLGIWLAFSVGGYDIWDGWIIAAIVLWAISAETGRRTGAAYVHGLNKAEALQSAGEIGPSAALLALNRTQYGVVMQAVTTVAALLILIDMIWKPGA